MTRRKAEDVSNRFSTHAGKLLMEILVNNNVLKLVSLLSGQSSILEVRRFQRTC